MVIKESLRLFPPGAIFSRTTDENIKLSKCFELKFIERLANKVNNNKCLSRAGGVGESEDLVSGLFHTLTNHWA